jgi:hypothetical protein
MIYGRIENCIWTPAVCPKRYCASTLICQSRYDHNKHKNEPPAASRGVSVILIVDSIAASCGDLDPKRDYICNRVVVGDIHSTYNV